MHLNFNDTTLSTNIFIHRMKRDLEEDEKTDNKKIKTLEEEEEEDSDDDDESEELKFAVVCSSNMNRSMEAHKQFKEAGLDVYSFGIGTKVRLPGPKGNNSFEFTTPYSEMKMAIINQGELQWYRNRGLLDMLDRNIDIKEHPERFQDYTDVAQFNVVFCFEARVYDELVMDLKSREPKDYKEIHILNLDVKDDPKAAVEGARVALELCQECVDHSTDLEESLPGLIKKIEEKYTKTITHMVHYL